MAVDPLEDLGRGLRHLLMGSGGGHRAIVSEAPGVGPEAERENMRPVLGGRIGTHIPTGGDASGFGGHGDAVMVVEDQASDVQQMVRDHIRQAQMRGLRPVRPQGKIRLARPLSLDGHTDSNWNLIRGPYSMFDNTLAAPSAGNSLTPIAVSLASNLPSPVEMLNRYPGALYMTVGIGSFSFVPTASTMTGTQECWFTDAGGAVAGLGIYNPAANVAAIYQTINVVCNSPLTDPGNIQLGTIWVNNIGIGGTPVSIRWQITLFYVAWYPDPWFNEQVIDPSMPAENLLALRSMQAQG